jgi:hypothetical protein
MPPVDQASNDRAALEAAWEAARNNLTQHWANGDARAHDSQWLADLRTYETLVERAAEELLAFDRGSS